MTPSPAPAPPPPPPPPPPPAAPKIKNTEPSVIAPVVAVAARTKDAAAVTASQKEDHPAADPNDEDDNESNNDDGVPRVDDLPPLPSSLPSSNNEKEQLQHPPPPTTTTTTTYPLWLICDRWKAENLLRIALCCGFSCALSVTPPQTVCIPQDNKLLIGVFGSFLSLVYPKLVFTLLGVAPYFFTMMVVSCGTTTVFFLVAEQYGQAWMVVTYSGYILTMSVLLYGTAYQLTSNEVGFYTGTASLLPILLLPRLAYPENPVDDKSTLLTATQMWTETGIHNPNAVFQNYLLLMCYIWLGLVVMILFPFPRTARSVYTTVIIPTALHDIVEYNASITRDAASTTTDEAGDAMEAQDPEYAAEAEHTKPQRNHHAMVHWAVSLQGTAGVTKYEPRIGKNEDIVTPLATLLADVASVARVSLFRHSAEVPGVLSEEDRQQHHHSGRLLIQRKKVLEICRDTLRFNNRNNTELEKLKTLPSTLKWYETRNPMDEYRKDIEITNTTSNDDDIDNKNCDATNNDDNNKDDAIISNKTVTMNIDIVADNETLHSYGTRFFLEKVERVKQSTILYLDFLNGNTKQQMTPNEIIQNRIEFNFMWIVEPLLVIVTCLYQFLILVAQGPSHWDWRTSVQSIQFALGFVVLFAFEIYLPNFTVLGVDADKQAAFTSATHQGWTLLGYALVWRPTVEGTIKKGFMRIVGTILGGFFGWAGCIVCAWSFDEHKAINPYGTVIWITFFTVVAAYLTIDAGPSGCFGQNYSFGFIGLYFILVQSLVMLTVYSQPVIRNVIVVARVVSTLVGVILAIILQVIPPNVYGRYPRDIVPCLEEIKSVFNNTVDAALSLHQYQHPISKDRNDDVAMEGTSSSSLPELYKTSIVSGKCCDQIKAVYKLLNHRLYLAKEAGALSFIPLMQLHPQIIPLLEEITITLDFIKRLERIIAGLQENPDRDSLIKELYSVMRMGRDDGGSGTTMNVCDTTDSMELKNVLNGTSLFPGVTKLVETRLLNHEIELQSLL